jgi:hypothetical protein
MSFEGLFVISVPELAAAIEERTPIHDSTPQVNTSVPCMDFVWGDEVVPFRELGRFDPAVGADLTLLHPLVPQSATVGAPRDKARADLAGIADFGAVRTGFQPVARPALGRARVPGVLPCIVFPPPVRDPALNSAPSQ